MRFKPGQKIVCIIEGAWQNSGELKPSYGDIVTVDQYVDDIYFISKEYPRIKDGWLRRSLHECRFAPLADISELTSILEAQPETV